MKNLRLIFFAVMASCVLPLVGCSNGANKSASADKQDLTVSYKNHFNKSSEDDGDKESTETDENQESSKRTEHHRSNSKKSGHKTSAHTLWNDDKDRQLEEFINNWAPKMHQTYEKFDGVNSLRNSVGAVYPQDLSRTTVNGETADLGGSKDGNGSHDYNVVAIYNYNKTVPPFPGRITYLFAFHNGQPIALVDESRDGGPRAFETQNQDVKNNFARIANM